MSTRNHAQDAEDLGVKTAEREFNAGADAPRTDPLSGEWADELTPMVLCYAVGIAIPSNEFLSEASDRFEAGYSGRWADLTNE